MLKIEMYFYVTKTSDGMYHVQNIVMGLLGQHHVHNEISYKKWKRKIDKKFIKESNGECNCGLKKSGDVREYDGLEWHNDKFEG